MMASASSAADVSALFELFSGTVNANAGVRQQAEASLKQASKQVGFGSLLLQMIATPSNNPADMGIRQAAAVFFKNYVEKYWYQLSASDFAVPEVDRLFIQTRLVEVLVGALPSIRAQLLACVSRIMRASESTSQAADVFTEQTVQLLQSADTSALSAGLSISIEVLKYRSSSDDKNMNTSACLLMPHLLRIGQQAAPSLTSPTASTAPIHIIVKSVVKSFFTVIRYKYSKHLLSDANNFAAWCTLLLQALQAPIPSEDLKPQDASDAFEMDKTMFWKMKKWAFRAQNRIVSRYGSIEELGKSSSKNEQVVFAKLYSVNFSEAILCVNMKLIEASIRGEMPLTNKTCNLMTDYLTSCMKAKNTWKVMKPHIMEIIAHFLFPRICFTEADQELWQDDPVEFLKTVFFSFDDFDSTTSACSGLIQDIVKARKKEVFPALLGFLNSVLEAYTKAPLVIANQRQKDGALYLMGNLSRVLLKSEIKDDMEAFLSAHVVPDLASPQPFLRLRAAWCLEQFAEMNWSNQAMTTSMFNGVMSCLSDKELPVRAQACVTIGSLLEQTLVQPLIPPHLGQIVQRTLELTNQVELDSLSYVMDSLVRMYPDELSPYAGELTASLRDNLIRLLESSLAVDEEQGTPEQPVYYFNDTDKMMAAIALIETLDTLATQMSSAPEAALRMEQSLVPLVMMVLQRRLTDLISETVSLADTLVSERKAVSPEMWPVFGEVLKALDQDGIPEFLPDCSMLLENFISYSADKLLAHPEDLTRLVRIIQCAMAVTDDGYDSMTDKQCAVDLMETLMLYCRGSIDVVIPHFLELIKGPLTQLNVEDDLGNVMLVRLLEIGLAAIYYNPLLALNQMQQGGWLYGFLTLFVKSKTLFTRVHDKRVVMSSLSAIFHCPSNALPAELKSVLPELVSAFVSCVQDYPRALEEREKLKKQAEEEDDEDDYADDSCEADDDDLYGEINDEDVVEAVEASAGQAFDEAQAAANLDDDLDDSWEDSPEELEEDLYYSCPLDQVDFAAVIKGAVVALASDAEKGALATAKLTAEERHFLQTL